MPDNSIKRAIERLVDSGLVSRTELLGCTEEEITQIEKMAGVRLPAAYRYFLAELGGSAGRFLEGSDFTCSVLSGLRSDAERLLEECGAERRMSPTEFVFAAHQGYQFLFFDCHKGNDPPVCLFVEGEEEAREVSRSFSGWLEGCVEDEIAAWHSN